MNQFCFIFAGTLMHLQSLFRLDNSLYQLPDTVSYLLHEFTTAYLWFYEAVSLKKEFDCDGFMLLFIMQICHGLR